MANNLKIKDIGNDTKAINFETFGGIEGFLASTSYGAGGGTKAQVLRRVVPWLAKAVSMTANAISEIPFAIVNDSGDVVDDSSDWKNKLGGIKSPDILFRQIASSLCFGKAYLIPTITNMTIVDLQYCAPQTIQPMIDNSGLHTLIRSSFVNTKSMAVNYNPAGLDAEDPMMMYFWLPDPDIEIGPALSFPAGTALMSANLLFSMDGTISTYAERGFVPATLLSAKGMPGAGEREKAENWWNRWLRGWTTNAAKIINAESMDVKRIGAGMDELKGSYSELTKQAIENIGTAFGIPAALFMSDMAFATEVNPMIKIWYSTSEFVNIYKTIESTFNEQLLNRFGLSLEFNVNELDAFQEDETRRGEAFRAYVSSGMRPSIAGEMLGLDLPRGVDYKKLDEVFDRDLTHPKQNPLVGGLNNPLSVDASPTPVKPTDNPITNPLNSKQIKELALWNQIATRCFRNGKGKATDFECKSLDSVMATAIRASLKLAKTEEEICKAFEVGNKEAVIPDIAVELRRANDLLERQFDYTKNINA